MVKFYTFRKSGCPTARKRALEDEVRELVGKTVPMKLRWRKDWDADGCPTDSGGHLLVRLFDTASVAMLTLDNQFVEVPELDACGLFCTLDEWCEILDKRDEHPWFTGGVGSPPEHLRWQSHYRWHPEQTSAGHREIHHQSYRHGYPGVQPELLTWCERSACDPKTDRLLYSLYSVDFDMYQRRAPARASFRIFEKAEWEGLEKAGEGFLDGAKIVPPDRPITIRTVEELHLSAPLAEPDGILRGPVSDEVAHLVAEVGWQGRIYQLAAGMWLPDYAII